MEKFDSPKVAVFSIVYDNVQRIDENGSSYLVLFQNALTEFKTGHGHPFTMEACWRILKNHAAWTEIEKPTQSNPPTPEKPPMPPTSSFLTIEESDDEHEICHGYLSEKEYQQLFFDEEALRETLKEEARAEKARAIAEKEYEKRIKEE
nr:hypothetical protein [Tanacetum cinerariifolium]